MTKYEKRIIEWIEKHLDVIVIVAITLISMLIRYSFRYNKTNDSVSYLIPWYETIAQNGGIFALKEQVGDYNLFYQFIIALWTYVPIYPLFAFKLLPILFDYLLASLMGVIAYRWTGTDAERQKKDHKLRWRFVAAYSIVVMLPTVFWDSAAWAQCDSIYVFFVLLSVYHLIEGHCKRAFLFLGIAFALKLQAILILPFFLYVYFRKRDFSILNFLIVPAVMWISALPAMIMGRGVWDVFKIYRDQTGVWPLLTLNYPSIWLLAGNRDLCGTYYLLKDAAVLTTLGVLIGCMTLWTVKRISLNVENMVYMAFLLTYTCVMFLPAMHERYGYLYEMLGVLILFLNRKTLLPLLSLLSISFITYSRYLYDSTLEVADHPLFALWNLSVYVIYFIMLTKRMEENSGSRIGKSPDESGGQSGGQSEGLSFD